MTPKTHRAVEPSMEIVPTEREEAERAPASKHDAFWMWNTEPSNVPARKERAS